MMTSRKPMTCPHHPGTELELKQYRKPYNCDGCKMDGMGPRYKCIHCDYELHDECMFPSCVITPTFLQPQIFKFIEHPPQLRCSKPNCTKYCKKYCDACGMEVNGFFYHCVDSGFDLHPRCVALKSHLLIDGLEFRLEKERKPNKCDLCNSKRVKGSAKGIPGWYYVSQKGNYGYHVTCIMDVAIDSWKTWTRNVDGDDYNLALEKLELPPMVKKKRSGIEGNKYWTILKVLIKTVLSIVFGDPSTLLANFAVEGVVQVVKLLR